MNQRPVHEIKIGNIKAVVWLNPGKDGKSEHHSVSLSRSFKVGEEWKQSKSFFAADLPKVADVATQAEQWIAGNRTA